jgi:hypothetical protein
MKRKLLNVTLLGVDCVNIERLIRSANICEKDFEFGAVKLLTSLPSTDSRVIQIEHIGSIKDYSLFCIQKMADYVDTEFVLIIQHDGFILNPNAWSKDFLKYDYIGAPIWNEDFGKEGSWLDLWVVGNGGFCVRTKKLLSILQELSKDGTITETQPEDTVICVTHKKLLESKGIRFAPLELARQFSFEASDGAGKKWNGEFGFHDLRYTDISAWSGYDNWKLATASAGSRNGGTTGK